MSERKKRERLDRGLLGAFADSEPRTPVEVRAELEAEGLDPDAVGQRMAARAGELMPPGNALSRAIEGWLESFFEGVSGWLQLSAAPVPARSGDAGTSGAGEAPGLEAALELLGEGDYAEASRRLEALLEGCAPEAADRVHWSLAHALLGRRQLDEARRELSRVHGPLAEPAARLLRELEEPA